MSSLSPVQPPTPAHFTMPILRSKDVLTNLPKALCLQLIQLITKTEIQPPPTHTHITWTPLLFQSMHVSTHSLSSKVKSWQAQGLRSRRSIGQRFSNLSASESPGGPVTAQMAGPTPRVSDSVGLGWGEE